MAVYSRYWGKSETTPPQKGWRPYVEHVASVALVVRELLQISPALVKVLARCLHITEAEVEPVVCWAAINHDLGKLHACFQWKYEQGFTRTYADVKTRPLTFYKNATYDPQYQTNHRGYFHGTGGYIWTRDTVQPASWRADLEPLLRAACAHHGGYASREDEQFISEGPRSIAKIATRDAAFLQDTEANREFFEETNALFRPAPVRGNLDVVTLAVAGLVAVADWLGSDEKFAPLRESWTERTITEAWNCADLRAAAAAVVAGNGFTRLPATFGQVQVPGGGFSDLQKYVGGLSTALLTIMEGPMGEGKTEAGFLLARNFLVSGRSDRLIYCLPTKATSNAMLPRVQRFAHDVIGKGTPVALAHGDASKVIRGLKKSQGDDDASTFGHQWFASGKRRLLQRVSVGTVDQVLVAALKGNRHHFVRTFAMSTSVLVIDEVHAVDVYMGSVLCELLRILGALQVRVVLLSATLSPSLRAMLVEAYTGQTPVLSTTGFPLITSVHEDGEIQQRAVAARRPPRAVRVERVYHEWEDPARPWGADPTDVTQMVQSLANSVQAGACVCWIRNTVGDAQTAYREAVKLIGKENILFIHAGLRGVDRRRIEAEILRRFGPEGQKKGLRKPTLVLGTQILEQSLDVDFDRLVRDFTTLDYLLQALGRCHRHGWNIRPDAHQVPVLEVFMPRDFLGLSGDMYRTIYSGARLPLVKTWDILQTLPSIVDPTDVPSLIELAFDERCTRPEFKPDAVAGRRANHADKSEAATNVITLDPRFGIDDSGARAPTRLGDGYKRILFLARTDSPMIYRVTDTQKTIDLTPFSGIPVDKAKVVRAALRSDDLWRTWSDVSQVVDDHYCSRSTFTSADTLGYRTDVGTRFLEALLHAVGDSDAVILLTSGSGMQGLTRHRGNYVTRHGVRYDPLLGMCVEGRP